MPRRNKPETFSNVDAAWLHMDTPTNMAMITGVMTFDAPIELERLKAMLEYRLLRFNRFRQRVLETRLGLRAPSWEYDPYFDLDAHVHRIGLPAPGGVQELQAMVSDFMSIPLDFTKPLWQIHLVEGFGQGCALIVRLHHCIADGISLVQVLLSMADQQPDAPWPEPIRGQRKGRPSTLLGRVALRPLNYTLRGLRMADRMLNGSLETLDNPERILEVAKLGVSGTMALGKLLLIPPDRDSILRGDCVVRKRAVWSEPIPLEDIKAIGKKMDCTVNDVLVAAMTGGLRRYLDLRGKPLEGPNIRAVVPFNIRPVEDFEKLGNRFGLVFLDLPVGVADSLKRLKLVKKRMDAIKDSPEAAVAFGILNTMGMTPVRVEDIIVNIFAKKATAVMTNVPGPRKRIYLAGQKLTGVMFWVPQPGGLGLGVSILSYAGDVLLGVASDVGLIPDPENIVEGFHREYDDLKAGLLA